jgi:hypothetical protein
MSTVILSDRQSDEYSEWVTITVPPQCAKHRDDQYSADGMEYNDEYNEEVIRVAVISIVMRTVEYPHIIPHADECVSTPAPTNEIDSEYAVIRRWIDSELTVSEQWIDSWKHKWTDWSIDRE